MKVPMSRNVLAALIMGLGVPAAALAADEELLRRIDSLSREIEQLKQQVQANDQKATKAVEEVKAAAGNDDLKNEVKRLEDKSLGKWLTIGGDFRYRVDSLRGETKPFTDVNATFQNAQQKLQGDFFANPSAAPGSSSFFGAAAAGSMSTAGALSALSQFSQSMGTVRTVDQARAFLSQPQNQGLVQGLGGFAVPVPAYTPRNRSIQTVTAGIDANAKVMKDVSFTGRLLMEKTFGSQDMSALSNTGA